MPLSRRLSLATASAAFAHHSHPIFYDWCTSITVEGVVERVEYKNPHSILVVRLDDGTAYTVDWIASNNLRRSLFLEPARTALTPGARVSVTGTPIRTAAEIRGYLPDFTREVNPRTIDAHVIRVGDSFNWSRPPQNPELCKGK